MGSYTLFFAYKKDFYGSFDIEKRISLMKNQLRRMMAGILAMLMVISSPMSSFAEVNVASPSEATTEYETASPSNASYRDEEAVVDDEESEEEIEIASPSNVEEVEFDQSQMVDGVVITVTADKRVFPKGAKLKVSKVINKKDLKEIDAAVEEVREENKNVASSNTFDIQVLNEKGNEIQPDNSKGTVNVKFSIAEKLNEVLDVAVYHVEEATQSQVEETETTETDEEGVLLDGKLTDDVTEKAEENEEDKEKPAETPYKAEALETEITEKKKTTEVEVTPESFSVYVVEFTYGELQYVLEGDTSVKLSEIQEKVELQGTVTAAEVSNEEYFTVTKDESGDDWTVTAKKAFNTEETLTLTIANMKYVIVVTDALAISGIPEFRQRKSYTIPADINPNNVAIDVSVDGGYQDCFVDSLSMVEGYFKGWPSEDDHVYHAAFAAVNKIMNNYSYDYWKTITADPIKTSVNGCQVDGYIFGTGTPDAGFIYGQLQNGNPVMVYSGLHWVVIYGYEGSTNSLDWTKFMIMSPNYGSTGVDYQHLNDLVSTYALSAYCYRTTGLPNLMANSEMAGLEIENVYITELSNEGYRLNVRIENASRITGFTFKAVTDAGDTLKEISDYDINDDGSIVSFRVKNSEYKNYNGKYYISARGTDVLGNWSQWTSLTPMPAKMYSINIESSGAYSIIADDTKIYSAPIEEGYIGGCEVIQKSSRDIVSVVGDMTVSGTKWFQLADSNWVKASDCEKNIWTFFSDISEFIIKLIKSLSTIYLDRNIIQQSDDEKIQKKAMLKAGYDGVPKTFATLQSNSSDSNTFNVEGTVISGHAQESIVECTVNFDPNGGQCPAVKRRASSKHRIGTLPPAYRYGYLFGGWFTSVDGGEEISSEFTPGCDMTAFAHWTRIVLSEGSCGENLNYILYGDGEMYFSGYGAMTSAPWENYSDRIVEVHFCEGLTEICNNAFSRCIYIREIELPTSLEEIGAYAFADCINLADEIVIDKEIKVGNNAFNGCTSINTVNLGEGTDIGESAFADCTGIEVLNLPENSKIGNRAFSGCTGIKALDISKGIDLTGGQAFLGCIGIKTLKLEKGIGIGYETFESCDGLEELEIPEDVKIGGSAFSYCDNLRELTLSAGIDYKDASHAFGYLSNLKKVTMPVDTDYYKNNKNISSDYVFSHTPNVEEIHYTYGRTGKMGAEKASYGSTLENASSGSLKKVIFDDAVTHIGNNRFENCTALESVKLPASLEEIGAYAFADCIKLKMLVMPENVETIATNSFNGCADLVLNVYNNSFAHKYAIDNNIRFEVINTIKDYSVIFHVNGHGSAPESQKVNAGFKIIQPANLTAIGYTFGGWYKEASCKNKWDFDTDTVNSDTTLYAKWTPISYTVKFDGNGATSGSMSAQSRKYDDKAALTSNAFKKTGYTFTGWNTKADGSGKAYANKATSNIRSTAGTTTLYAQWKKATYTITYNLNSGKNSTSNPATYTVTTATITLADPTRTGYTFGGWYSDSGFKTKVTTIKKGSTGNKTFYAKWTANKYTIAFNANGGTGTAPKSISTAYGKTVTLTANPFKKTGYTFTGWNTKKDGSGTAYANKAPVKNLTSKSEATVTLYAQWKINIATIKYNGNGSTSGSMKDQKLTYNKSAAITSNAFKKTGYTFTGWNTKKDGKGTTYKNGASVKNLADLSKKTGGTVTLYAQWSKTKYTITYKLDGGKNNSKNPASFYVTTADIKLQNPTKTGYSFDGWYSDSKLTKKATTTIKKGSTGNKTFYAKWKINTYKITYNLNGGKNSSKNPASYKVTTSDIKLQNPTKTGYTFGGWYSDSKFKTKVTMIKKGNTGNKTLYAKWTTNKYTIAFNANGGSGSMSKMTGIAYGSSKTLTANKFTRKNYTFQGWSTGKTGDVQYANKASVKNLTSKNGATVTLYAIWKADTYTIAFNANGGSGSMSKLTVGVASSKALTANAFKKTGYTFAGWSTSKTGSVKYKNKATVKGLTTKGKTVTLYAVWTANKYTIAFNANGGSGSMKNLSVTYDKKVALAANAFKKKNYIFDGWNTKADGSGKTYKNKESVSNLSSKSGTTVTLYAQWKAEKPPITVSVQNPSRTQFEYTDVFPTRWVSTVNLDKVDVIANHTGDNKNSISVTVTGTVIDIAKNHTTGYACYCILKKKNGEEYTRLAPYFKEAYAGKAFESTVIFKDIIDGEYTIELTDADGYASAY